MSKAQVDDQERLRELGTFVQDYIKVKESTDDSQELLEQTLALYQSRTLVFLEAIAKMMPIHYWYKNKHILDLLGLEKCKLSLIVNVNDKNQQQDICKFSIDQIKEIVIQGIKQPFSVETHYETSLPFYKDNRAQLNLFDKELNSVQQAEECDSSKLNEIIDKIILYMAKLSEEAAENCIVLSNREMLEPKSYCESFKSLAEELSNFGQNDPCLHHSAAATCSNSTAVEVPVVVV
jgi:hypothetical protein